MNVRITKNLHLKMHKDIVDSNVVDFFTQNVEL